MFMKKHYGNGQIKKVLGGRNVMPFIIKVKLGKALIIQNGVGM